MKKIFFLTLTLFLLLKSTVGQQRHVDSVKHLLITAKQDANKVKLYWQLGYYYQWTYPDTSLFYYNQGLQLANKLDDDKARISILIGLEEPLSSKGNYSKALQVSFKALALAETLKDGASIFNAFRAIANCYYYSNDYKNSIIYYRKATSCTVYFNRNRWLILGLMGRTYYYLNNLDSALKYTKQAYNDDLKAKFNWPVPYVYLAKIYEKKGDFKNAVYYAKKGVNDGWKGLTEAEGYNNLADVYKTKGDADSSILYANKALTVSVKYSFLSQLIDAARILTSLYKSKHLADSALKYQDMMLVTRDSVFSREKITQMQNLLFNDQMRRQDDLEKQEQLNNRIKIYGLLAVLAVLLVLAIILWRNSLVKQKANEKIQKTLAELKTTQTQLIQSEKMASLGELTAGIAHEIQNPLNFVNNFSEVNQEMLGELEEELNKGDIAGAKAIAADIRENEKKINHHGKRADFIVKGMLLHSRNTTGEKEATNINAMANEFLKLSYHGLRAKDKNFNVELVTNFDNDLPKVIVAHQDIGRVLLNLFNNAFYAVNQKQKTAGDDYKPEVSVSTSIDKNKLVISVKDNGNGIPAAIKEKIMQPFFTTKPTGEGTGLGLSLSYDIIVKGHGGSITIDTNEGEFTEFIVQLPNH